MGFLYTNVERNFSNMLYLVISLSIKYYVIDKYLSFFFYMGIDNGSFFFYIIYDYSLRSRC